jgi:hypothetical protein
VYDGVDVLDSERVLVKENVLCGVFENEFVYDRVLVCVAEFDVLSEILLLCDLVVVCESENEDD